MPDDDRDDDRRRDDAARDVRDNSPASVRRIADEVSRRNILASWNDVGVDFGSFRGKSDHARLLDYFRDRMLKRDETELANAYALKMRAREAEIDEALTFVRELRARRKEVGTEGRRGLIALAYSTLTAAAGAALTTYFATRK